MLIRYCKRSLYADMSNSRGKALRRCNFDTAAVISGRILIESYLTLPIFCVYFNLLMHLVGFLIGVFHKGFIGITVGLVFYKPLSRIN